MARAPSASPSRNLDSQLETLYNTAVQSFVRRDHVTTQVTLSRLLKLFKSLQPPSTEPWYDLRHQAKDGELEGWLVKTLKLVISSHASLYTDPPVSIATLPSELRKFLPPSPPEVLLSHLKNLCTETVFPPRSPDPGLLPPSLLSTLLLASITLSLPFTHHLAEDWIALLPDAFILAISPENRKVPQDPETKKRVEAAREGYLKVVELFVGEVLAREGEWEMARGFLDGEAVMGSKRKEVGFSSLLKFRQRVMTRCSSYTKRT